MPKKFEKEFKKEARQMGLRGKSFNAYVYGTPHKTGWKSKRKKVKGG